MSKPRVLVLFDFDWDQAGFSAHRERYDFESLGFDLFAFPNNARLLNFSIRRFVEGLASRYSGEFAEGRLAAVVSNQEQFGALAAALLAERLGLPGTPPAAIVRLQHKHFCRQLIEQVAPEANLRQHLLPDVSRVTQLASSGKLKAPSGKLEPLFRPLEGWLSTG